MNISFLRGLGAAVVATCLSTSGALATTNLIVNGDFEAGATGFMSDHTFTTTNLVPASRYAVVTDASTLHGSFSSAGDNTTGTGNMLAINGSTVAETRAWAQSVSVSSGTTYDMSFWMMSLFGTGSTTLEVFVDGTSVDTASNVGGVGVGVWEEFTASWTAGISGLVDIEFVERSTAFGGNDYALDDISFVGQIAPIPLPAAAWMLLAGLGGLYTLGRRRT